MNKIVLKRIISQSGFIKKALIFILVGVFIFSNLAPFEETRAAANEDGMMFYGLSGNTTPQIRFYDAALGAFDSPASPTVSGAQPVITRLKSSPTKNEYVAAYQDTSGNLRVMCYDGTNWTNEWSVPVAASGTPTTQRFDIAYETNSGDVVVAYSRNTAATNALAYRAKSGADGCGTANWDAAVNFPTTFTITTGTVQWVKAAADGRAGSDLSAWIWADSNRDLGGTIWSGTIFGNLKILETTLEVVSAGQDVDSFDLAYESLSGDLMVAFGSGGSGTTNGAWYNMCTGGTAACSWGGSRTAFPTLDDDATNLDLSADPNSDMMAFASIGNGGSDLQAAYWNGNTWAGYENIDASCETPAAGRKLVQTGWLTNGAAVRWFITYDDGSGTGLSWFATTPGGVLTTSQGKQGDWAATPAINDIRSRYDLDTNPLNLSEVVLTLSDATNSIFAKRLTMDTIGNLTWANIDGGVSLGTKFSHPQQGFSFAYRRSAPAVLVVSASAGIKTTALNSGDTSQFIHDTSCTSDETCAAFKLAASGGAVTVSAIKISEIGTVAANTDLANPTLIYDTDANYANGTAGIFGSQTAFAADQTVTFTNAGLTIPGGGTYYFYIRFDLANGGLYPAGGQGLDFRIAANADVTASGSVIISGAPAILNSAASACTDPSQTCVRPQMTGYTNISEPTLNYAPSCTDCGARLGPGAAYEQTITITGYGFGTDPGLGARATGSNKVEIVAAGNKLINDDGTGNTNVSAWSNTAITIQTDTTVSGDDDASWGANFGGNNTLKVTAGGQAVPVNFNFYIFPQVTSLTVPTAVANAAREYDSADTDGVITLNGTRFGALATDGWVRIFGCDSVTCASPTGSVAINSWSNTAIEVQVPNVIADNVYTGGLAMQQGTPAIGKTHTYTTTGFRVLPRIAGLTPDNGIVGDDITLSGNHLCQNNAICPSAFDINNKVTFNSGVDAIVFTSWSNTTIVTKVPAGTVSGAVAITSNSYISNSKNFSILSTAPGDPTNLNQFKDAALTQNIAVGAAASTTPIYLTMIMQAGVPGGTLYPQIEYQPVGTAFSCSGAGVCASATEGVGKTGPGPVNCSQVANGCAIAITPVDDVYHWQARIRYNVSGTDYYSNWVSFGGNGEGATDFKIDATGPVITFPGAGNCSDAVTSLATNGATITWYLNESADGQIEYSQNSDLSSASVYPPTPAAPDFSHSYGLNNLDSNTTYYFRVKSEDAENNQTYKPAGSPYCSFMTTGVTQPAKTVRFYVSDREETLAGGVATSTVFSIYVPEDSVSIKSAFLELAGISPVSGTNNLQVQINGQTELTYSIASASGFKILYKVDPANINLDPVDNTLILTPSADTNIISAKIFATYSFEP